MTPRGRPRPSRDDAPAPELMDRPGLDPEELARSLRHLEQVNRFLGGTRSLLRRLPPLLPPSGPLRILDIGAGDGAVARSVAAWAGGRGRPCRVVGLDLHPQTLEVARARTAPGAVALVRGDARALPFPAGGFHAALLTLALHHFHGEEAVAVLREAGRVAAGRVLVSDLERGWPNRLGAALLARTVWRGNAITRHDGPLSVERAYRAPELVALARAAGLPRPVVRRHPFYRLVLTTGTTEEQA